jgi:hypothetical protein
MLEFHPMHEYGIGYYFREIGITDQKGFFAFVRAIKNFRFEAEHDAQKNVDFNRCDNSAPRDLVLPSGFHEWNYDTERCSCGSSEKPIGTTNSHRVFLTSCRVFRIPVQTYGGFITYLEYNETDKEADDMLTFECSGRTLQEVFRCILEWQWVHLNMGNNELVAVAANDFINTINPPDEIIDWLWSEVPDQHVAKYLRGIPNPRNRNPIESTPDMTTRFNLWIEEHMVHSAPIWPYGPR